MVNKTINTMKTKQIILIASIPFVIYACKKEKAAEEPVVSQELVCSTTISFTNDVLPILTSYNCGASGCHSTASAQDGVRLTNYNEVNSVTSDRLLGSIKQTTGFALMPAGGGKLTNEEINKIECWIKDGKQNN